MDFGGSPRLLINLGDLNFGQHKYMIGVYSHIVLILVALIFSKIFKENPVDQSLTYYGWLKLKRENKTTLETK